VEAVIWKDILNLTWSQTYMELGMLATPCPLLSAALMTVRTMRPEEEKESRSYDCSGALTPACQY
jgi:hypothetical protein